MVARLSIRLLLERMELLGKLVEVLPSIAGSPSAILAYICLSALVAVLVAGKVRAATFAKVMEHVPPEHRSKVAKQAGFVYDELAYLTPEQSYKIITARYRLIAYIVGILALCFLVKAGYESLKRPPGESKQTPSKKGNAELARNTLPIQSTDRSTASSTAPYQNGSPSKTETNRHLISGIETDLAAGSGSLSSSSDVFTPFLARIPGAPWYFCESRGALWIVDHTASNSVFRAWKVIDGGVTETSAPELEFVRHGSQVPGADRVSGVSRFGRFAVVGNSKNLFLAGPNGISRLPCDFGSQEYMLKCADNAPIVTGNEGCSGLFAWAWNGKGAFQWLGTNFTYCSVEAISPSGKVLVGTSYKPVIAAVWIDGELNRIPFSSEYLGSSATAVSADGMNIAGIVSKELLNGQWDLDSSSKAFLWKRGREVIYVPKLLFHPKLVRSDGLLIGNNFKANKTYIWRPGEEPKLLNELIAAQSGVEIPGGCVVQYATESGFLVLQQFYQNQFWAGRFHF